MSTYGPTTLVDACNTWLKVTTFAFVARLSAMGEMSAAIAHELNQPLTAMVNYVRAATRTLKGKDQGRYETLIGRLGLPLPNAIDQSPSSAIGVPSLRRSWPLKTHFAPRCA